MELNSPSHAALSANEIMRSNWFYIVNLWCIELNGSGKFQMNFRRKQVSIMGLLSSRIFICTKKLLLSLCTSQARGLDMPIWLVEQNYPQKGSNNTKEYNSYKI